jgi:phosphoesterase RecJ-like protein
MKKETKEFKKLIEKSKNILILTHLGPDPDAFGSSLIMKKMLNTYYPEKKVIFKTKQLPKDNYPLMDEITIVKEFENGNEDLVIVCDMGELAKCVGPNSTFELKDRKLIYVDHHQTDIGDGDLTINELLSSATEQVIVLWKDLLGKKFKYTKEIAILGQIGIVSDTGRFLYELTTPYTHELMAELKRVESLDLEDMLYREAKFPFETLKPLRMFLENFQVQGDMAYTYITEEQFESLEDSEKRHISSAKGIIKDSYLRYIQGTHWGFVLSPRVHEKDLWQASFRSTKGYQEVDKICEELGGGGHKYSAASKIDAKSREEALEKVFSAIEKVTHQN